MKRGAIIFGILVLILTLAIVAFVVPVEYLVPGDRGDIVYAQRCTRLILRRYEITRSPSELRVWLSKLDGAPWQEGGAIFTNWGIDHPDAFVSILEGFQGREREDVVEMISYAVVDSRMTESFDLVFDKSDASIISQIRAEIRKEAR